MAATVPAQRRGKDIKEGRYPGWLKTGFWICVVIAVAVVLRRVVALVHPAQGGGSPMAGLDAVFASHAVLTLAHILPAMAFVLVTPFVLSRRSGAFGRSGCSFHWELWWELPRMP